MPRLLRVLGPCGGQGEGALGEAGLLSFVLRPGAGAHLQVPPGGSLRGVVKSRPGCLWQLPGRGPGAGRSC